MAVQWDEKKCLRCGLCVGVCPFNALRLENEKIVVDPDKCTNCGICVKACPVRALILEFNVGEKNG